jgi:hypothetical protein
LSRGGPPGGEARGETCKDVAAIELHPLLPSESKSLSSMVAQAEALGVEIDISRAG